MSGLLRSRITGAHGVQMDALLEELLMASYRPDQAFDVLEQIAEERPHLRAELLRRANAAGRMGYCRIRNVRQALVRLGSKATARIFLEATHKSDPTHIEAAA